MLMKLTPAIDCESDRPIEIKGQKIASFGFVCYVTTLKVGFFFKVEPKLALGLQLSKIYILHDFHVFSSSKVVLYFGWLTLILLMHLRIDAEGVTILSTY